MPTRTSHGHHAWAAVAAAVVVGGASTAAAQTVAGTWTAGATRVRVDVQSWGPDCGTRPQSSTRRGEGRVTATEQGDQIAFGPPLGLRTDGCWSENRALRRVSTTHRGSTWVTRCRTPADDSRAETGTYTLQQTGPTRLERTGVSRYDWALNESRCVATVTETQVFDRVAPAGAAGTARPVAAPSCTPGAAARIRVRPEARAIEPGERLCLRATVLDAAGCALPDAPIAWRLQRPAGVVGQLRGRCFEAGANAATAEGTFQVIATSGALDASASVIVRTADLSDLRAKRIAHAGDAPAAGRARAEDAASLAARTGSDDSQATLFWVSLGAGLALLALAAASAVLVSRRRSAARALVGATEPAPPPLMTEAPPSARGPASNGPAAKDARSNAPGAGPDPPRERNDAKICPVCRRGYPASAVFCPHDSASLVSYEAYRVGGAAPSDPREPVERARCPTCGTVYPRGTRFCGKDGEPLVDFK